MGGLPTKDSLNDEKGLNPVTEAREGRHGRAAWMLLGGCLLVPIEISLTNVERLHLRSPT